MTKKFSRSGYASISESRMPVTFVAHYLSISRSGSHCRGHGRQLLRLRFDRKRRELVQGARRVKQEGSRLYDGGPHGRGRHEISCRQVVKRKPTEPFLLKPGQNRSDLSLTSGQILAGSSAHESPRSRFRQFAHRRSQHFLQDRKLSVLGQYLRSKTRNLYKSSDYYSNGL
jgi:hypothetical protein